MCSLLYKIFQFPFTQTTLFTYYYVILESTPTPQTFEAIAIVLKSSF